MIVPDIVGVATGEVLAPARAADRGVDEPCAAGRASRGSGVFRPALSQISSSARTVLHVQAFVHEELTGPLHWLHIAQRQARRVHGDALVVRQDEAAADSGQGQSAASKEIQGRAAAVLAAAGPLTRCWASRGACGAWPRPRPRAQSARTAPAAWPSARG